MTVAIYIRVSTDEQATQGFSLEAQKDRLIAYCKSQDWDDYEIFNDDGYSGTNLNRPGIQRLIRAVQKKRIKAVVVYRLDRLSRRQRDVLHLLEEVFEANDVAFKSATEPFDTSTPLGKAMIGILAVFAQLERETIIERVTEGHRKRARSGLWGGGPEPFGYRWNREEQKLEIVESEAHVVRGIYQRIVSGESLSAIADWARSQKPDKWWDHNVVRNTVLRSVYQGRIEYGVESASGNHEPIVDPETAALATADLERRDYGSRPVGKYLLSGLLRCGECGEPMGHSAPPRTKRSPNYQPPDYYVCARKHRGKSYYKPGEPCTSKHFNRAELDEKVIERVKSLASDPNRINELMETSPAALSESQVAQLNKELAQIGRKIARWDEAYEKGDISRQKWKSKVDPLEQERMKLEQMIDELEGSLTQNTTAAETLKMFEVIRQAWDRMEFTEQQTVLRAAIDKVEVFKDGSIRINWRQ